MPKQVNLSQQVAANSAGLRLDQAAAELFPDFSRGRLQQWIKQGELTINGKKAKPSALTEEFEILIREIKVGSSRADGLRAMAWRVDLIQDSSF